MSHARKYISEKGKRSLALIEYQNALWDFVLEHCDVLEGGTLFVKFHTGSRSNFEYRIRARIKGYHREDVKAKKKLHEKMKNQ